MKKILIILILSSCSPHVIRTADQRAEDKEKIAGIIIMGVVGYILFVPVMGIE